jgi:hypothetical protein
LDGAGIDKELEILLPNPLVAARQNHYRQKPPPQITTKSALADFEASSSFGNCE